MSVPSSEHQEKPRLRLSLVQEELSLQTLVRGRKRSQGLRAAKRGFLPEHGRRAFTSALPFSLGAVC